MYSDEKTMLSYECFEGPDCERRWRLSSEDTSTKRSPINQAGGNHLSGLARIQNVTPPASVQGHDVYQAANINTEAEHFEPNPYVEDSLKIEAGKAEIRSEIRRQEDMAQTWITIDPFSGFPQFNYMRDDSSLIHIAPFAFITDLRSTMFYCADSKDRVWRISWKKRNGLYREVFVHDDDLTPQVLMKRMQKRGCGLRLKRKKEDAWDALLDWLTDNAVEEEILTNRNARIFSDGSIHAYKPGQLTMEEVLQKCR